VSGCRRRAALGLVVALILAGCGSGATVSPATFPPATFGPDKTTGPDAAATRDAMAQILAGAGLELTSPQVPYRPGESPSLAAAPRDVYQVALADDPTHGFISIYGFADDAAAAAAGREQATYVASGPGRVQFPPDSRFVIRQLGPTLVFFVWSPANSPDARTADIQTALEALGVGIPVPR
jgi:hypothetical protein